MDIGQAVEAMKRGRAVTRAGWNGRGMYLYRVDSRSGGGSMTLPFVAMRTVQGDLVPWLCSQTDLLAEDWQEAQS